MENIEQCAKQVKAKLRIWWEKEKKQESENLGEDE